MAIQEIAPNSEKFSFIWEASLVTSPHFPGMGCKDFPLKGALYAQLVAVSAEVHGKLMSLTCKQTV